VSPLADRDGLRDFAPLAERALSVDGDALIRFRSGDGRIGGFVRLPFEVLAGRTIEAAGVVGPFDITVSAKQFLVWLDGDAGAEPAPAADTRPGQQALLDSIVLTAQPESGAPVRVPLSVLSALTRMGFLPRGGEAAVDTAPGWIRIAAAYGSTYISDGKPLGLLSL
jgi:hypothetical protein